jgi:hypothetical protein
MPEISRFMGMIIQMYYEDHSTPHIHVRFAENRCKIDFYGNLLNGSIPLTKLHIVKRWTILHRDELLKDWEKIRKGKLPGRIEPWV